MFVCYCFNRNVCYLYFFINLAMHRCLPPPPPLPPNWNRGKHPCQPVHQRVHYSTPTWLLTKLALTKLALGRKLVLPELRLSKLGLPKLVLSHKLTLLLLKLVLRSKVGLELVDVLLAGQLLDELLPTVEELLPGLEHLLAGLEQTLTAGTKLGSCSLHQWTAPTQLGLW